MIVILNKSRIKKKNVNYLHLHIYFIYECLPMDRLFNPNVMLSICLLCETPTKEPMRLVILTEEGLTGDRTRNLSIQNSTPLNHGSSLCLRPLSHGTEFSNFFLWCMLYLFLTMKSLVQATTTGPYIPKNSSLNQNISCYIFRSWYRNKGWRFCS